MKLTLSDLHAGNCLKCVQAFSAHPEGAPTESTGWKAAPRAAGLLPRGARGAGPRAHRRRPEVVAANAAAMRSAPAMHPIAFRTASGTRPDPNLIPGIAGEILERPRPRAE